MHPSLLIRNKPLKPCVSLLNWNQTYLDINYHIHVSLLTGWGHASFLCRAWERRKWWEEHLPAVCGLAKASKVHMPPGLLWDRAVYCASQVASSNGRSAFIASSTIPRVWSDYVHCRSALSGKWQLHVCINTIVCSALRQSVWTL